MSLASTSLIFFMSPKGLCSTKVGMLSLEEGINFKLGQNNVYKMLLNPKP